MTKAIKWKKQSCILLAFIIILSGMYFSNIDTCFFDINQVTGNQSSTILKADKIMNDVFIYAEELFTFRSVNTATLREYRGNSVRYSTRMGLLFFVLAIQLKIHIYLSEMIRRLAEKSVGSWHFIIRYIHQQDGLKD